jgi:quinol monooxygenase YgiN
MAIGVYFGVTGLNTETYAECLKQLKKAGLGHPPGRSYHVSFGPADKLMVFDIWTSQAAFDKFGKTLLPIMQQLGATPEAPTVMEIHHVIRPPVAAAKKRKGSKGAKRAGARRKSKKR